MAKKGVAFIDFEIFALAPSPNNHVSTPLDDSWVNKASKLLKFIRCLGTEWLVEEFMKILDVKNIMNTYH